MPVQLRQPNNPYTDEVILGILRNVIHNNAAGQPCTYLAQISASQTGLELTFIDNKYQMILGMNAQIPYALHLSSDKQPYEKCGARTYEGGLTAIVEYCGRWDENPASIDNIRRVIAADLERIKANIEDNDSLQFGNAAVAISVTRFQLSPYKGTLNAEYPGLILVERILTLGINILPYDALS
ncbi:MAG: hypothetical protein PVSMB5_19970 [Ktedonobacteraceae bacterium]